MEVTGYVRVSTAEQTESGAGLEAQRVAIRSEARKRGWILTEIFEDSASGKSVLKRPGLEAAIRSCESGTAEGLLVAKLDRLSRSVLDFAALVARSQSQGWALVVLDSGVDTSTPQGKLMHNMLAAFAEFERDLISTRTKEGLRVRRAQGVTLGRPVSLAPDLRERILQLRRGDHTPSQIAALLNAEGVPTAHGGKRWYHSTVSAVVTAANVDPITSEEKPAGNRV